MSLILLGHSITRGAGNRAGIRPASSASSHRGRRLSTPQISRSWPILSRFSRASLSFRTARSSTTTTPPPFSRSGRVGGGIVPPSVRRGSSQRTNSTRGRPRPIRASGAGGTRCGWSTATRGGSCWPAVIARCTAPIRQTAGSATGPRFRPWWTVARRSLGPVATPCGRACRCSDATSLLERMRSTLSGPVRRTRSRQGQTTPMTSLRSRGCGRRGIRAASGISSRRSTCTRGPAATSNGSRPRPRCTGLCGLSRSPSSARSRSSTSSATSSAIGTR